MMALASHTPLNYMRLCREIFVCPSVRFFDDVNTLHQLNSTLPDFHYRLYSNSATERALDPFSFSFSLGLSIPLFDR